MNARNRKISKIPQMDRPREKLRKMGPQSLSDMELLAILLGSGTQTVDVMTLANRLLKKIDGESGEPDLDALMTVEGIGPAKASVIVAALEFARRRIRPEGIKISIPPDVLPLIRHLADRKQEHFICVSLNGAHEVIASRIISVGLVNRTQVHPREVFADPITDRASAIIVAHNHTAGDLTPSSDDIAVTNRLKAAGETLGIMLIDHIIFNNKSYYSFLEHEEFFKK